MADDSSPYKYSPSTAAAIIFLVGFTITTIWHIFIGTRKKIWYLSPLICGGLLEIVGYISRSASTYNVNNLSMYIIQFICILIAPALFAASIYMVFGRLALVVRGQSLCLVKPSWVTKIFVGGDITSFFVQIIGAAMFSRASNTDQGKTILLIGLMAQIVFFGIFIIIAVVFHQRLGRAPTPTAARLDAQVGKRGWKGVMLVIYLTSLLIFIRSLFRFIESAGGSHGPLFTHEFYFYIFDSLLMFLVVFGLIVFHPADYVPNKSRMKYLHGEVLALN
ncbi:RTA1 like protein-domain-containing protein [Xylogone sp. PMI_703]|nr:RTA1 like protein-domain-containing protein [Xylogone sp. PMI_703]